MRQLHRSVVLQPELCTKAKLCIFRSVYVPILVYDHECWIMRGSRVPAAEMGFLRRISGLTLLGKVKSADIRESLNIESLFLPLQRSQLCWYGHVTRMSQEIAAKKMLYITPIGRRPRELDNEITLKILVGLALAFRLSINPLSHRVKIWGGFNSSCCPRDPQG